MGLSEFEHILSPICTCLNIMRSTHFVQKCNMIMLISKKCTRYILTFRWSSFNNRSFSGLLKLPQHWMVLTLVLQVTAFGMPLRSCDHHLITWQLAYIETTECISTTPFPYLLPHLCPPPPQHSADFCSLLAPIDDEACPAWSKCLYVKLGVWDVADIPATSSWKDPWRFFDQILWLVLESPYLLVLGDFNLLLGKFK